MGNQYAIRPTTLRARQAAARLESLAEHCANEGSLADYARIHSISDRQVTKLFRKIRDGLGWQAA